VLLLILATATPIGGQAKGSGDCDPYPYCNGRTFPNNVDLEARHIKCDNALTPRDHCCLPQARHLVCYNIKVDGADLNYNEANNARSTDFAGLCGAMARLFGNRTGKHSSAVIKNGGGTLVWRYGEWAQVEAGTKHVENIACQILP